MHSSVPPNTHAPYVHNHATHAHTGKCPPHPCTERSSTRPREPDSRDTRLRKIHAIPRHTPIRIHTPHTLNFDRINHNSKFPTHHDAQEHSSTYTHDDSSSYTCEYSSTYTARSIKAVYLRTPSRIQSPARHRTGTFDPTNYNSTLPTHQDVQEYSSTYIRRCIKAVYSRTPMHPTQLRHPCTCRQVSPTHPPALPCKNPLTKKK